MTKEKKEEEEENQEYFSENPTDTEVSSKEYGKAAISMVE
jgi:hypothetical protein